VSSPPYIELRCRSAFSFLDGASLPEDLIAAAAALGCDALALADRNGLYGAPRFLRAARQAGGLRPLVGAEVVMENAPPLLLLVENQHGYRNLCRLLTRMHTTTSAATLDWLAEHESGLIALGGAAPRSDLQRLAQIFSPGRLYLEMQRHLDDEEAQVNRAAVAQAETLGLPLVASNDVRYARPEESRVHDVLACVHEKTSVDTIGRRLLRNRERHLKSPAHMAQLFRDCPVALHATRTIAERCTFTLDDLGYSFPRFPVPAGESEQSLLDQITWTGAAERYRPLYEKARRQIAHELDLIGRLGLAGYFLVVWDIVRFARSRRIMVQGRGSAANSATCYALGITAVDPVGMDLLFERFLSEERVKTASDVRDRMPDIDLDLPSGARREEVIQYVYRKYGARGAAMTANVITYRPKMAVRDAGRALGFSEEQLSRMSRHLPHWGNGDTPLAAYLGEAGFPDSEPRTRHLATIATAMLNLPRHLGQHSGGMVICGGALDEVVPLQPATMPGRVVVQWDKDDCADLGIVKVDLLGLGMLAVLEDAVPLILEHEGITIDYAHLPADDAEVYRMLCAADTVGMFQVESRAQMATLPRLRPERFYDLVVEVAIIRPGPIVGKMVSPYLQRRAGRAPVTYPHPCLEPILKRTLGVPLFQEQLIRMAMAAAGFSGGQAEELRRAMGFKRSAERMKEIDKDLRAGMTARQIAPAAQEEIVAGIKSFALYGFPESHAASFALIAYASAFLKAHHPAAFLCALLNNQPMGFYHPATLIRDAAQHGVRTLPVDMQRSDWGCTLERMLFSPQRAQRTQRTEGMEGKSSENGPDGFRGELSVRLGLKYVGGMRAEIGQAIVAERRARPFASLIDFRARVNASADLCATLAEIGAFASLGELGRREALWQVEALARSGELFARVSPEPSADISWLPEASPQEEMLADLRATSVTTGPHPISFLRPMLEREGIISAAELAKKQDGERVRVAGVVVVRQRPATAKGIVFVTVEDETGFANAVVMPDEFARWRSVILGHPALVIEGRVQNRDHVVTLKPDRFSALPGRLVDDGWARDFH
jgi:error-prone DNA polymerase